jgi:hypothetical protein
VHSRRHEWQCHRYALDMESITPAVLISHQMFVHYTPKCCFATTFEVHTHVFSIHAFTHCLYTCLHVWSCLCALQFSARTKTSMTVKVTILSTYKRINIWQERTTSTRHTSSVQSARVENCTAPCPYSSSTLRASFSFNSEQRKRSHSLQSGPTPAARTH